MSKLYLGVLGSGAGSNMQSIVDAIEAGALDADSKLVLEDDTPESLHARIQVQEHIAFPEALNILASGKYRIEGRRVIIG